MKKIPPRLSPECSTAIEPPLSTISKTLHRIYTVKAFDIDSEAPRRRRYIHVREFGADNDLVGLVRCSRVNCLRECLFRAGDKHQEFRLRGDQLVLRHAKQRALGIDRMHDGPVEREEADVLAFEWEIVE